MPLESVGDVLRQVLDERREREADLVPHVVRGRHVDGTTIFRRQDGECEERGAITGLSEGQIVDRKPAGAFQSRGAAGIPPFQTARGFPTAWIESVTPSDLERGTSPTVTIAGRGFTESLRFELLEPFSLEANADVAVDDQRLLDAETVELDVTVAPDARLIDLSPVGDASRRVRKGRAYRIVERQATRRYLAYWDEGGTLRAAHYLTDGAHDADIGTASYEIDSSELPRAHVILSDVAGNVGDGSLLLPDVHDGEGYTRVVSLDFVAGVAYQLNLPAGWKTAGLLYRAGFVYWIEVSPNLANGSAASRLRRARADLTSVTTIGPTHTFVGQFVSFGLFEVVHAALTDDVAGAQYRYQDGNFEGEVYARVTHDLSSGAAADTDEVVNQNEGIGVPIANGKALSVTASGARDWAGSASADWQPWDPAGWAIGSPQGASASADRQLAAIYESGRLTEGGSDPPPATPSSDVAIADHPTTLNTPDLVVLGV